MVSNENTCAVENSSVDLTPPPSLSAQELLWRDFWYELRGKIDGSWLALVSKTDKKTPIVRDNDSVFVWNTLYATLANAFEIDEHYSARSLVQTGIWFELLPRISLNPQAWIEAAGVVGLFNTRLQTDDLKNSKILSSDAGRQLVVRLSKCLTLYQRCAGTGISDVETCGLWLLFQTLKNDYPQGWKRIRLRFDKTQVEKVEEMKITSPSAADTRAFKRLWSALADKLEL